MKPSSRELTERVAAVLSDLYSARHNCDIKFYPEYRDDDCVKE